MAVLLSVSESPHGVSLDAISLNSDKNFLSYLMRTDGQTDGQTMANSIVPLPHFVRRGTINGESLFFQGKMGNR